MEYPVITDSNLSEVEDFEQVVVKTNEDGSIVYLKDVARVELGQFTYDTFARLNGEVSSGMAVNQLPGGNAVETEEGIHKALTDLKRNFPPGVDYVINYETVSAVHESVESVFRTMILALLLVSAVVFFFLQNWRSTLIPVLTIPVSIVASFTAFTMFDLSINNLTMLALILAIGIVVDDAIVVVEAVQKYIDDEDISAKKATKKGMKDITAPLIAICLVLTAVFVPVGFIPGMVGQLYVQFSTTIAVAVVLSTVIALTLTPALCSILLKPTKITKDAKGLNKFFYRFNKRLDKVTEKYANGVQTAIKKKVLVIISLVIILGGTAFLFFRTPTGFIPEEDIGLFMIGITLPHGASSARTDEVLSDMYDRIKDEVPELKYFTTISGRNNLNQSIQPNVGSVFVALKEWEDRSRSSAEIIDQINALFSDYKKAEVMVATPPPIPGMGSTGGFSVHLQNRRNIDIKDFEEQGEEYIAHVNERDEIGAAYTLFTTDMPNYRIKVDRDQAAAMRVPINSIYNNLSSFFGSTYVNDFTLFGRNFRVVTQADSMYRMDIEHIKGLYIDNAYGNPVPLSELISYELAESPAIINHFNIYQSIEVMGDAASNYSSGDAINALKDVANGELSSDLAYEFSGSSLQEEEAGNQTALIFALCIVLVFFLLAALYESWSVPFSVMLAVPLGAFGSILALFLIPNVDNNIFAQVGLLVIIGLSAKNAILIVEFALERVHGGMELTDATLEAVKLRLRPIIMTSISFILGILPLLFSSGPVAVSTQTIGWTVFGGMTAATFLPIFIVPVLFVSITRLAYGKEKLDELEEKGKKKKDKQKDS
nr:efflux RND transporter permease subunit [Sphingobacterium sp. lm-10]